MYFVNGHKLGPCRIAYPLPAAKANVFRQGPSSRTCASGHGVASSRMKWPAPAMKSGGATFRKIARSCVSAALVMGSPFDQGKSTGRSKVFGVSGVMRFS
jgi:hypothetical protein